MVVEVALRVEHVVLLLQYGGNQFLCSGLAISARDADDGGAQMDTVVFSQLLKGGEHVFHQNQTIVTLLCIFLLVNHGVCRSLFQC